MIKDNILIFVVFSCTDFQDYNKPRPTIHGQREK